MLLIFPFHAEILKTHVFVYSEMIISLCLDLVCVLDSGKFFWFSVQNEVVVVTDIGTAIWGYHLGVI